ncbi:MAG TPA: rRNA adenine N-6-methyltransferase family protein [Steroidobacteraceae bacterium]
MSTSHAGHDVSKHTRHRTRGAETLLFARNFFRHPRMLGSIIPSSRFLVRQLLAHVDWNNAGVIVEYGPGSGVITKEILRRMRPDAHLVTIETNPEFVQFLSESLPDPRLQVVQDSAVAVDEILRRHGLDKADYIISGIPFSTLDAPLREQILRKTSAVLQPGGAFLVFQFSTRVLPDLRRIFHYVKRSFQPLNVLPAHLFICEPGRA